MGAVVSYLAIMALLLVLLIIEYAHIRQRIERTGIRTAPNCGDGAANLRWNHPGWGSRCGHAKLSE